MNKLLILKYMEKITKDDILKYSLKEEINLSENELDLIYTYIKKYPEMILDKPLDIIDELKESISIELYNKLLELYDKYKDKLA